MSLGYHAASAENTENGSAKVGFARVPLEDIGEFVGLDNRGVTGPFHDPDLAVALVHGDGDAGAAFGVALHDGRPRERDGGTHDPVTTDDDGASMKLVEVFGNEEGDEELSADARIEDDSTFDSGDGIRDDDRAKSVAREDPHRGSDLVGDVDEPHGFVPVSS